MRKICLVAVNIRSLHNVGAFLRTADGFSSEIILVGITPRPKGGIDDTRLPHVTEKAHKVLAKTALGAEVSVRWRYFADFNDAYKKLKSEGYYIAAIEQDERSKSLQSMSNLNKNQDVAIVMGPEVTGLSSDVLRLCDEIYEIPMSGNKESFNVSVAAGIALYQTRFL